MNTHDSHPTEDELALALLGDERDAAVEAHVAECDACQAMRAEIVSVLELAAQAPVPEPGADFEARMWARIQPALAFAPQRAWQPRHVLPLVAWAATIGAVVVGGYAAGYRLRPTTISEPPSPVETTLDASSESRERVLLAAVDAHLAQTEMLLVELLNAPPAAAGTMDFARETAGDLVSSARLYRETAREAGDVPVSLVLDDLETVLLEVARSGDAGAEELAALRGRIEDDDLLFKVRAVTHDIRARQSRPTIDKGAL